MRLIDADKGLISKIQIATGCNFVTANEIVEGMSTENAIPIPDGATNGDMIKDIFPSEVWLQMKACEFNKTWWNAPYNGGKEE